MVAVPADRNYDGKGGCVVFPPFVTQKEMDLIEKKFVVRDSDIFVVAYPKSGTTWMEQIVHLMLNNGVQGDKVLSEAVPWVEGANRYQGLDKLLNQQSNPRRFHSHLLYHLMPGVKLSRAKYIYVARNPKDNAVSFYFHSCSKLGYDGTWDEFFDLYIQGKVGYGSFFAHVLDWWKASKNSNNILFVKYEDMKRDLKQAVKTVADFLQVKLDEELWEAITTQSTFESMANNSKANLDWVAQRPQFPKHMRKGIVGDWRNHFTSEQNEIFETIYAKYMKDSDLQFDFGEGVII
ncbi:MAG: sulfotransferase domain-containing protein [Prochloraceae cyanobacterium]|nr:sulfotransferase domain-containing protein [Prochloraceae cyanobacterium]